MGTMLHLLGAIRIRDGRPYIEQLPGQKAICEEVPGKALFQNDRAVIEAAANGRTAALRVEKFNRPVEKFNGLFVASADPTHRKRSLQLQTAESRGS
jgi:hypothetical protein